ncbi:hypothetical protein MNEG_16353 [Monoraphidium neglectum]|uniref:Uncharacterized protein n=1 Tax=Monoraphidium neglectum TaxID=145388 RepID=A0A0D2LNQ8_9CHLO|nr:hypothetical protein MNEG_16353 [Monoraphidium neglectum]KIY91611.1 hypothetical protein MNEG_16353 [Monoraphidium neglectum]|eukprot:XP_013890631.1 hypothetical protein MNEG_16353 [Monoraphidium neglectum]
MLTEVKLLQAATKRLVSWLADRYGAPPSVAAGAAAPLAAAARIRAAHLCTSAVEAARGGGGAGAARLGRRDVERLHRKLKVAWLFGQAARVSEVEGALTSDSTEQQRHAALVEATIAERGVRAAYALQARGERLRDAAASRQLRRRGGAGAAEAGGGAGSGRSRSTTIEISGGYEQLAALTAALARASGALAAGASDGGGGGIGGGIGGAAAGPGGRPD